MRKDKFAACFCSAMDPAAVAFALAYFILNISACRGQGDFFCDGGVSAIILRGNEI